MIFGVFGILAILASVAMIFIVIIQKSKGGGLSSTFGGASGASQLFGARRSNEAVEKITWYLAGALALIALLSNILMSTGSEADTRLRMQQNVENGLYNSAPSGLVDPGALLPTESTDPSAAPAPATPSAEPATEDN